MEQAKPSRLFAIVVLAAVSTLLVVWSLTHAYVGDESFHLLAAKLIAVGKKPYVDFFYQHPPVFVYIMAAMLRISGVSWRSVHLFSALCIIGSILFAIAFGRLIYRDTKERWWNATFVTALIGVNAYVLMFATNGLPFGFCLLCVTASLYWSQSDTSGGLFLCGLLAATAGAASLLVAPIIPVLLIWIWLRERPRLLWVMLGVFAGFLPLFAFLLAAPHQTIRDVIGFHLIDRPGFDWRQNLTEVARWLLPTQGLILAVVAVASLRARKESAIRLCALIALVLGVVLLVIKATASFYFVVLTPLLSILAASWLTDAIARDRQRGVLLSGAIMALYLIGLLAIERFRGIDAPYREVHQLARSIEACAPSGNFYASEATYFEASTLPPAYMENRYVPSSVPDSALSAGAFDAVLIAADNPKVVQYRLAEKYARRTVTNYSSYKLLLFCGRVMHR
ncbi:MAG: ArnT family glycosyltransferase [Gemmatimonadaceae bacterium]